MVKFEHEQLLKEMDALSVKPEGEDTIAEWIANIPQLSLLLNNLDSDEYIASAHSSHLSIHTAIVPREQLTNPDINDLLRWQITSTATRVGSLIESGKNKGASLVDDNLLDRTSIKNSQSLVFHRRFEGMTDSNSDYYEILQEFAHISNIHWRDEHNAYCRFDEYGELDKIVSISNTPIELVTVNRKILDNYLYLSKSAIVRAFYFELTGRGFFRWIWDNEETKQIENTHYRQNIQSSCHSYTKGVQIVTPKDSDDDIYNRISNPNDDKNKKYVEFIAYDLRHDIVRKISTDPKATINYFQDQDNKLPFELSPAFFNPKVLSKYKSDSDKYTLSTGRITCRAAWCLKRYDINEAGQVQAYICDLRHLPNKEILHWLNCNEEPKIGISKRAYIQDFEGGWNAEVDPLDKVKHKLRGWRDSDVDWWKPKNENVLKNVTAPITDNKDEWLGSFMNLSKLVTEGLKGKNIKEALKLVSINYEKGLGNIKLLEILCQDTISEFFILGEIQMIRNFDGHASGSEKLLEFELYYKKIIKEHGGYPQHFNAVCDKLLIELDIIENKFKEIQ